MRYLLDTNICIYIIKKKPVHVLNKIKRKKISDIAISSITLSELEYGVYKSSMIEKNKIALAEFSAPIEIAPYDETAADKYGFIRSYLEKNGIVIGAMDMLIAAHASALNVTLVTNNVREFERIPGLKIENWTA